MFSLNSVEKIVNTVKGLELVISSFIDQDAATVSARHMRFIRLAEFNESSAPFKKTPFSISVNHVLIIDKLSIYLGCTNV